MNDNNNQKPDPQSTVALSDSEPSASPPLSSEVAPSTPTYPKETVGNQSPIPVQGTVVPTVPAMPQVSAEPFQGPQQTAPEPTSFGEAENYQQPPQISPPEQAMPNQQSMSQENTSFVAAAATKSVSRFRVFIIVAIVAIAVIYSLVTYLYFQNKKLKQTTSLEANSTQELSDNEALLPTVVPPLIVSNDTVKILNGNVVLQGDVNSESKILVDKENYTSTGITGFARVAVSNDAKMLCFESWPPSPEPALFVSNADGSNIKEVSPNRQNCIWSSDNLSVFYTDYLSKTSGKNIYQYMLASSEEKNITLDSQTPGNSRQYEIVGLSSDGSKLICKYTDPKNVTGECTIDLSTYTLE